MAVSGGAAMKSCIAFELRHRAPLLMLPLVFFLGCLAFILAVDRVPMSNGEGDGDLVGMVMILLLIQAVLYPLIDRDFDERCELFLIALPVESQTIFRARWMVVLLLVTAPFFVVDAALGIVERPTVATMGVFAPGQFDRNVFLSSVLFSLFMGISTSVSLAFAYAPASRWVAASGVLIALHLLSSHWPALYFLSPSSLFSPRYHGDRLVFDWAPVIAQCSLALCLYLIGWATYRNRVTILLGGIGPGAKAPEARSAKTFFAKLVRSPFFGLVSVCFALWAAELTMAPARQTELGPTDPTRRERIAEVAMTRRTKCCLVTHHAAQAAALDAWIGQVDAIAEFVFAHLEQPLPADPITISLLHDLAPTTAGNTQRGFIRLSFKIVEHPEEALSTVAHELAHAAVDYSFASPIRPNPWRALLEGHAELISSLDHARRTGATARAEHWFAAASAAARDQVSLDDILDPDRFAKQWSDGTFYNLAELLVATIVDHYGPKAPKELFRVIAESAGALDSWPAAFARVGLNFGQVARLFRERLADLVALHDRSIRSIPEYILRAELDGTSRAMVKVETRNGSSSSLEMSCRFRALGGSSVLVEALDPETRVCAVPRHLVKSHTVEVGLTISVGDRSSYHSAWQMLSLP
jgi:hypothetical protein